MKKLIPIYVLLMFCSTQLFSQFQIGIGGGLSFSNMITQDFDLGTSYRTGYMFATPFSYQISPKFTASIIPGFTQKGYKNITSDPRFNSQTKMNYLHVIPEIKYSPFDRFYAGLGFFYSRQLGIYVRGDNTDWIDWKDSVISLDGDKDYELGVTPSISYHIGNFQLSVRYLHSLTNVLVFDFSDLEGEITPNVKSFNRSFEVAAFYVFGG